MHHNHPCLQRRFFLVLLATAALASGAIFPGTAFAAGKKMAEMAPKSADTGHLVILRSANLGQTIIDLSIDGKHMANINFNGHYETDLSAGQHVLSTLPVPNREQARPSEKRLTVVQGRTYKLTAFRSDVAIVLR